MHRVVMVRTEIPVVQGFLAQLYRRLRWGSTPLECEDALPVSLDATAAFAVVSRQGEADLVVALRACHSARSARRLARALRRRVVTAMHRPPHVGLLASLALHPLATIGLPVSSAEADEVAHLMAWLERSGRAGCDIITYLSATAVATSPEAHAPAPCGPTLAAPQAPRRPLDWLREEAPRRPPARQEDSAAVAGPLAPPVPSKPPHATMHSATSIPTPLEADAPDPVQRSPVPALTGPSAVPPSVVEAFLAPPLGETVGAISTPLSAAGPPWREQPGPAVTPVDEQGGRIEEPLAPSVVAGADGDDEILPAFLREAAPAAERPDPADGQRRAS